MWLCHDNIIEVFAAKVNPREAFNFLLFPRLEILPVSLPNAFIIPMLLLLRITVWITEALGIDMKWDNGSIGNNRSTVIQKL